ncbi:MAG TPA: hypothetical protein VE988_10985 [Gemmataceae bacterium]|nr:hypothetical protein [Gemmataceae bacterium]
MIEVTVMEAQQCLPDLITAAQAGDSVAIRATNGGTIRLVANRPRPPVTGVPRAGSFKGFFEIGPDFNEPLEELREYMA